MWALDGRRRLSSLVHYGKLRVRPSNGILPFFFASCPVPGTESRKLHDQALFISSCVELGEKSGPLTNDADWPPSYIISPSSIVTDHPTPSSGGCRWPPVPDRSNLGGLLGIGLAQVVVTIPLGSARPSRVNLTNLDPDRDRARDRFPGRGEERAPAVVTTSRHQSPHHHHRRDHLSTVAR